MHTDHILSSFFLWLTFIIFLGSLYPHMTSLNHAPLKSQHLPPFHKEKSFAMSIGEGDRALYKLKLQQHLSSTFYEPTSPFNSDFASYRENASKTGLSSSKVKSYLINQDADKRLDINETARLYSEGIKNPEYMVEKERRHFPSHMDHDRSQYHRPLFLNLHERNAGRSIYPESILNRTTSPRNILSSPTDSTQQNLLRTIDHPRSYEKPFIDMEKSGRVMGRHEFDRSPYIREHKTYATSHAPLISRPNPNIITNFNMGASRHSASHR